jgi:hypothetical protein
MRQILVVMTDTHSGHKLGLMSPDVLLMQVGKNGIIFYEPPELTEYQLYLWYDIYVPAINQIARLSKGDPIVGIHAGDPTQGLKYMEQLATTNLAEHIQIAVENMTPLLALPNVRAFRFVMGTDIHEFGEGSSSVLVAAALKLKYPGLDVGVCEHGLANVGGVTIDYAHHGPPAGNRSWLKGNIARYTLRDIMMTHLAELGQVPPDLVLRGHVHEYVHEMLMQIHMGKEYWSRLVVVPSMCGLGSYGRKATRSMYIIRNGLVAFVIEDGKIVDVEPYIHTMDIRTHEVI